ncbi:MAG: alpha/beta hydrolase [Saprospiraceae bacterium]|nr:alpha/beta hydrolase [Saprospiraceae bacterium]
MDLKLHEEGEFKYVETNPGKPVLMLLHGLMGALSNFDGIIKEFSDRYNVVVPLLPIFELPIRKVSVKGFVEYVERFVEHKGFDNLNILGNSLGGHVALLFVLANEDKVNTLTLTGSSGLFESAMGSTFPKRGSYEYIKQKTEDTFYDPAVATKELVDEVYETVNDKGKVIRILATAKSAIRHNVGDDLDKINAPTLIIWGKEDKVTPYFVGEKFHELIPNSTLVGVEKCGHAPMMERSDEFNKCLDTFLVENN